MQWIELFDLGVEISATPIDSQLYYEYMDASGQSHADPQHKPLVGISASEAAVFASWMAGREGWTHRLPTLTELQWLAKQNEQMSIWPCTLEQRSLGNWPSCPYEWLDCRPEYGGADGAMHCATHPAWLVSSSRKVVHAAFADARFPYVTFRLVRQRAQRSI